MQQVKIFDATLYGGGQSPSVSLNIEEKLEIARMQPWQGSPAIIASDGLFNFGAEPHVVSRK